MSVQIIAQRTKFEEIATDSWVLAVNSVPHGRDLQFTRRIIDRRLQSMWKNFRFNRPRFGEKVRLVIDEVHYMMVGAFAGEITSDMRILVLHVTEAVVSISDVLRQGRVAVPLPLRRMNGHLKELCNNLRDCSCDILLCEASRWT